MKENCTNHYTKGSFKLFFFLSLLLFIIFYLIKIHITRPSDYSMAYKNSIITNATPKTVAMLKPFILASGERGSYRVKLVLKSGLHVPLLFFSCCASCTSTARVV